MSDIKKKSNNKNEINIKKNTLLDENIDSNLSSPKNILNTNILNNSTHIQDKKKIKLNKFINISIGLGTSKIKFKDFIGFSKGSMLVLDKKQKESLDIFMNGDLIASGEIVVLEKKYGLRITSIKNSLKTINTLV